MKTVTKIKAEMNSLQVELSQNKHLTKPQVNRIKKRHSFLKICEMYINTNPTPEFLKKEKDRLSNKIKLIDADYTPDERLINAGLKKEEQKEHKDYNKIMGLPKFKEQLRSIQFLLS